MQHMIMQWVVIVLLKNGGGLSMPILFDLLFC